VSIERSSYNSECVCVTVFATRKEEKGEGVLQVVIDNMLWFYYYIYIMYLRRGSKSSVVL